MEGEYKTRFVSKSQGVELINLFHLARTALAGESPTKYDRMLWAVKAFCKDNPEMKSMAVYKDIDGLLS